MTMHDDMQQIMTNHDNLWHLKKTNEIGRSGLILVNLGGSGLIQVDPIWSGVI